MGSRGIPRRLAALVADRVRPVRGAGGPDPKAVFSRARGSALLAGMQRRLRLRSSRARELGRGARLPRAISLPEIAALKAEAGKPIIALGGVTFARSLVAARGLVDQFDALMGAAGGARPRQAGSSPTSPRRCITLAELACKELEGVCRGRWRRLLKMGGKRDGEGWRMKCNRDESDIQALCFAYQSAVRAIP